MLSWIILIVLGAIITGLMFYSFGIVLFSKNKYDDAKKTDKEKIHATTEKFRSKSVGRA
jgi:hypothetical protein